MKVQNYTPVQGDDWNPIVAVRNGDGVPVVIDGYTASAQIRRGTADSDPSVDATFTCTPSGASVQMSLSRTITVGLSGFYMCDVQIVDPSGHIQTIARIAIDVIPEVTRP